MGHRSNQWVAVAALILSTVTQTFGDSVLDSKHNLSVSGPGTVRASTENEVCIFCHAPHNASGEAPLWNRYASGTTYLPYSSSTALASPGQPTGASKLCLSCHDGTVAFGMVRSRPGEILFPAGNRTLAVGSTHLGTDLSNDHPISFFFDQGLATQHGELVNPTSLNGAVRLDQTGSLQCTACHDPHDNQYGNFLVQPNQAAALCAACHVPAGWSGSAHASSLATWNGLPPDPWPHTDRDSVADNACESCHRPHGAATGQRLPIFGSSEASCVSCHNGHVAVGDLVVEFGKASKHPVAGTEVHDPVEDLVNPPRHVECADCHNPHRAGGSLSPGVPGPLQGVRGLSSTGIPLAEISSEYELCFRCHADSVDRGPSAVNRQFIQTNTRTEFSPAGLSYHPILAAGKNPDVPSLISPYTTTSILECTDCHNNDGGPATGGVGPDGPHGSVYSPLLERRLVLTDGTTESSSTYALCYKCHSRTNILNDTSFKDHDKHIRDVRAACTTCHDSHGVESVSHLVNFNTQYVTPASNGRLEFVDTGRFRGSCSLRCHGKNHDSFSYP